MGWGVIFRIEVRLYPLRYCNTELTSAHSVAHCCGLPHGRCPLLCVHLPSAFSLEDQSAGARRRFVSGVPSAGGPTAVDITTMMCYVNHEWKLLFPKRLVAPSPPVEEHGRKVPAALCKVFMRRKCRVARRSTRHNTMPTGVQSPFTASGMVLSPPD
jgi:hypothetical protein